MANTDKKWTDKDRTDRKRESEDRAQEAFDKARNISDKLKDQLINDFSVRNGRKDEKRNK